MNEIDDKKQRMLELALQPGETLHWSGIPRSSGGAATLIPGCMGLVFLLMSLALLAIGASSLSSDFAQVHDGATLWLLIGGGLLIAAGVLIAAPFIMRSRVRNSIWGVTNVRVVRVIEGKAMSITPQQIAKAKLSEGKDGVGTITLVGHIERSRMNDDHARNRSVWKLPDVADAATAHRLIEALIAG